MHKKHEANGKVSQSQVETLNQTIPHPPDLDNLQNFHNCASRVKTGLTFHVPSMGTNPVFFMHKLHGNGSPSYRNQRKTTIVSSEPPRSIDERVASQFL